MATRTPRPAPLQTVAPVLKPQDSSLAGIQRTVAAKPGRSAPVGGTFSHLGESLGKLGTKVRTQEEIAADNWLQIATENKTYRQLKEQQEKIVRDMVKSGQLPEGIHPFAIFRLKESIGQSYNRDYERNLRNAAHRWYRQDSSPTDLERPEDFARKLWESQAPTDPVARRAASEQLPGLIQGFLAHIDGERNKWNIAADRRNRQQSRNDNFNANMKGIAPEYQDPPIDPSTGKPEANDKGQYFTQKWAATFAKNNGLNIILPKTKKVPVYALDAFGNFDLDEEGNKIDTGKEETVEYQEPKYTEKQKKLLAHMAFLNRKEADKTYRSTGASGHLENENDLLNFVQIQSKEVEALAAAGHHDDAATLWDNLSRFVTRVGLEQHGPLALGNNVSFLSKLNIALMGAQGKLNDDALSGAGTAKADREMEHQTSVSYFNVQQSGETPNNNNILEDMTKRGVITPGTTAYAAAAAGTIPKKVAALNRINLRPTEEDFQEVASEIRGAPSHEAAVERARGYYLKTYNDPEVANMMVAASQSVIRQYQTEEQKNTTLLTQKSWHGYVNRTNRENSIKAMLKPYYESFDNRAELNKDAIGVTILSGLVPFLANEYIAGIHATMSAVRNRTKTGADGEEIPAPGTSDEMFKAVANYDDDFRKNLLLMTAPDEKETYIPDQTYMDALNIPASLQTAMLEAATRLQTPIEQLSSEGEPKTKERVKRIGGNAVNNSLMDVLPTTSMDSTSGAHALLQNPNEWGSQLLSAWGGYNWQAAFGQKKYQDHLMRLREVLGENQTWYGNIWRNAMNWGVGGSEAGVGMGGFGKWTMRGDIPRRRKLVMGAIVGMAQESSGRNWGYGPVPVANPEWTPNTPLSELGLRNPNQVAQMGYRRTYLSVAGSTVQQATKFVTGLAGSLVGSDANPVTIRDESTGKTRPATWGDAWNMTAGEVADHALNKTGAFVNGIPFHARNYVIYTTSGVVKLPDGMIPSGIDPHGNLVVTDKERKAIIASSAVDQDLTFEYVTDLRLGALALHRDIVTKTGYSIHGVDLTKVKSLTNPQQTLFTADPEEWLQSLSTLDKVLETEEIPVEELRTHPKTKDLEVIQSYGFYVDFLATVAKKGGTRLVPIPLANYIKQQGYGVGTITGMLVTELAAPVRSLIDIPRLRKAAAIPEKDKK